MCPISKSQKVLNHTTLMLAQHRLGGITEAQKCSDTGSAWQYEETYNINPLTTNAIFLSDLSKTFISNSSNFLKNKFFLHEFLSSMCYQDTRHFGFF